MTTEPVPADFNLTDTTRLVRWKVPVDDAEKAQRYFVLEDNGDRLLVVDVRSLYPGRMASTHVYRAQDLEDVPAE